VVSPANKSLKAGKPIKAPRHQDENLREKRDSYLQPFKKKGGGIASSMKTSPDTQLPSLRSGMNSPYNEKEKTSK
jgi:hypothetical protein